MPHVLTSCSQFTVDVANEVLGEQFGAIHSVELQSRGEGVGLIPQLREF